MGKVRDVMTLQGKSLPLHVQQEFADYLKCGRLEHGFLRVQCAECHHEHFVPDLSPFVLFVIICHLHDDEFNNDQPVNLTIQPQIDYSSEKHL